MAEVKPKADKPAKAVSVSPDIEAVKREWVTNRLSIRELARAFACSESWIRKKAKLLCWPDREDISATVRSGVRNERVLRGAVRTEDTAIAIQGAVKDAVAAVDGHVRSLTKLQTEADHLVAECELIRTAFKDVPVQFTELLAACGGDEKRAQALAAALTIQKRGFLLEKAASIYAKTIPQHRQALDLDADGAKAPDVVPLEERLKKYGEDAAIESADNVTRMQKRA